MFKNPQQQNRIFLIAIVWFFALLLLPGCGRELKSGKDSPEDKSYPLDPDCDPLERLESNVGTQYFIEEWKQLPYLVKGLLCKVEKFTIQENPELGEHFAEYKRNSGSEGGNLFLTPRLFSDEITKQTHDAFITHRLHRILYLETAPEKPSYKSKIVIRNRQVKYFSPLQLVLVHEAGHVAHSLLLDSERQCELSFCDFDAESFYAVSWINPRTMRSENPLYEFNLDYAAATIGNIDNLFDALRRSNFASLYGATTPFEDFAEFFTWLMMKNYHNSHLEIIGQGGRAFDNSALDDRKLAEMKRLIGLLGWSI